MTRLSPLQATIAISVVDRLALPAGEEFIGIIRVQDVRATEKDKVKIGESFRGDDVVRGTVVREFVPGLRYATSLDSSFVLTLSGCMRFCFFLDKLISTGMGADLIRRR